MQLLDPKLIQLDILASDWQSAIKKSAEPLIKEGVVTNNYPKSVIEIAEKNGPYIVIAPQIALSHASITDGAIKNGPGLTVLSNPVKFGNKANDPVRLVFTLSSIGDDVHLKQMSDLVSVLQEPKIVDKVVRSRTINEITQLFNGR